MTITLHATVDHEETRRREQQRDEDLVTRDTLWSQPPDWADHAAWREMLVAVERHEPSPAVWREERIAQALFCHVHQRRPLPPRGWDTSARAVALRAYTRAVRWRKALRAASVVCSVVMAALIAYAVISTLFRC